MNAETKVRLLNARDPLHKWSVGEDIYCLHCDGVFKAEDVIEDSAGDPNCPLCKHSSPIDFFKEPWWREDTGSGRERNYQQMAVGPDTSSTG